MSTPELELSADPIPTPVSELIAFFGSELGDVSFPDVDAKVLAELSERVRSRAADVARARQVLDEVRVALEEARAELDAKARRALAYAHIYAEELPAIAEQLDQLALSKKPVRKKPRAKAPAAEASPPARKSRKKRAPTPLPLTERPAPAEEEVASAA